MHTVLVTDHPAPTTAIEATLLASIQARLIVAETGDEAELLSLAPGADAILTCFKHVTPAVVRAATRLRVIGRYGVGVDNIAVDVATERGIPVTNVPVYCVDEVAEHAIALMFSLARKTATYDASIRAGGWDIKTGMPMYRIAGSTFGILGFGHIGRAVAGRALGLGMQVLASDGFAKPEDVAAAGVELVELDELLTRSDIVSIHVPLNAETHHMIDAVRLARMKPTSFLINCARGAVVDLDALVVALHEGQIAGAGIDVFEPERLSVDHPLIGARNTVLTPHVAFYSEQSIAELQRIAIENVIAVLTGGTPTNVVNAPATQR